MKIFLRILTSILFTLLFALFLITTSIKFQILNYDFVTKSFERNNVYTKIPGFLDSAFEERKDEIDEEEIEGYTNIKNAVTPQVAQEVVEKNLKSVLLFVNEGRTDVSFYFPASRLGFEEQIETDTIPFSGILKNRPNQQEAQPNLTDRIQGGGKLIFLAWVIITVLLLGITFAVYKLGTKGMGIVFIINGVLFVIIGLLGRFFLIQMARDLVTRKEPAERIIAMMASSILPEIVNTWMIIAGILLISGVTILILRRMKKIK